MGLTLYQCGFLLISIPVITFILVEYAFGPSDTTCRNPQNSAREEEYSEHSSDVSDLTWHDSVVGDISWYTERDTWCNRPGCGFHFTHHSDKQRWAHYDWHKKTHGFDECNTCEADLYDYTYDARLLHLESHEVSPREHSIYRSDKDHDREINLRTRKVTVEGEQKSQTAGRRKKQDFDQHSYSDDLLHSRGPRESPRDVEIANERRRRSRAPSPTSVVGQSMGEDASTDTDYYPYSELPRCQRPVRSHVSPSLQEDITARPHSENKYDKMLGFVKRIGSLSHGKFRYVAPVVGLLVPQLEKAFMSWIVEGRQWRERRTPAESETRRYWMTTSQGRNVWVESF